MVTGMYEVLNKNRWICAATLVIGLPGEEREDVLQTIELVSSIEKYNTLILVPLFFNPSNITRLGDREGFYTNKITKDHWRLLVLCWKHNIKVGRQLYNLTSSENHNLFTKVIIKLGIKAIKLAFPIFLSNIYRKHAHKW